MDKLPLVERLRLDKWLWAARLFKTRALAAAEVELGRVRVNGHTVKPARELKAGDQIELRAEGFWRCLEVKAVSAVRGPAPLARTLYQETESSLEAVAAAQTRRRLAPEPAQSLEQGRPTKRDRRELDRSRGRWQRWSASIDETSS